MTSHRGAGRAKFTSFRKCTRCGVTFGNTESEDYRHCAGCRKVINHADTGSLSASKFII